MKIYLAGPLFTPYERTFLEQTAQRLRDEGFQVFVPHEEILAVRSNGADVTAAVVFDKDFEGLAWADAVVALLDGAQVDDGTACEVGMFHALMLSDPTKKGIVGWATDFRTQRGHEGKGLNLFVLGCIEKAGGICHELDEVIATLKQWK